MSTPREELEAIAETLGLVREFPPEVEREVEAILAAPGIDDPALVDRTDLPFVTVDSAHSRDLDQALAIARDGDGYHVAYAIADAAHFVRPGSALYAEAERRGASYYFPGFAIPMLPRALSEGIVSLNPDGPRRALVFHHRLDARGEILGTRLERARIRSRAKLSFSDVQRLVDTPSESPLAGAEYETSLRLLRDVGRARTSLAIARGLVRYRREELEVELDGSGRGFVVVEAIRDEVELWNEQISLLCNAEGGRFLEENAGPSVKPVYRVQAGPEPERLATLARLTAEVAAVHGLAARPWIWEPETTSLADYLAGLPHATPDSSEDRLVRALSRQAVLVNLRSSYSTEPGLHAGVGAEPYARFSAPMREIVGVHLHAQAQRVLVGGPQAEADETEVARRDAIVAAANRSRETQRRVTDLANELVLDRLFTPELAKPRAQRRRFVATIVGIAPGKLHLRLDEPPLDVKLYLFDLARAYDGARLEVVREGAELVLQTTGERIVTLGDRVEVVLDRRDPRTSRWILAPG